MPTPLASWGEFAAAVPDLAANGKRLLYQNADIAQAYLASTSNAGAPRLHPVFPVLADNALWLFIVAMSPKYRDLLDNGRFALHALPTAAGGEEFALQGHAEHVDEAALKAAIVASTHGRQGTHDFEQLFRCCLRTALYTRWDNWNSDSAWPNYTKWRA